jgi:hypothetical protein
MRTVGFLKLLIISVYIHKKLIHDFDWLRNAACLPVCLVPTPSLLWDSWRSNLNIETMLQMWERQTERFIEISAVENEKLD